MMMSTTGTVALAVAEYTGGDVLQLECVPDPSVVGVYALRADVKVGRSNPVAMTFLVRGVALNRVHSDDLEEVEFTEWPPVARTA